MLPIRLLPFCSAKKNGRDRLNSAVAPVGCNLHFDIWWGLQPTCRIAPRQSRRALRVPYPTLLLSLMPVAGRMMR